MELMDSSWEPTGEADLGRTLVVFPPKLLPQSAETIKTG